MRAAACYYDAQVAFVERLVLEYVFNAPSSDIEARRLADGDLAAFAAWRVEQRNADELLMCDVRGRTRSWFRVSPVGARGATLLQFGSAVIARRDPRGDRNELGRAFDLLLGFHKLYSRVLLGAARGRLLRLLNG